jgi:putative transposase
MAHTYTSLLSHVVFSTKDRAPLLDADLKPRLFPYLGGIVRELGGVALSINGPTDHVHILASLPATVAVSDFAGKVKANSSGWIHKTFPARREFVSASQREKVRAYIAGQEEHHGKVSFQEEFFGFPRKHGITYDERYIFD